MPSPHYVTVHKSASNEDEAGYFGTEWWEVHFSPVAFVEDDDFDPADLMLVATFYTEDDASEYVRFKVSRINV